MKTLTNILAGFLLLSTASTAWADDGYKEMLEPCRQNNLEQCIKGCTEIIDADKRAELLFSDFVDKKTLSRVYYIRGLSYRELGHYSHAIRDFDKSADIDPSFLDALFAMGQTMEEWLIEAQEQNPDGHCYPADDPDGGIQIYC